MSPCRLLSNDCVLTTVQSAVMPSTTDSYKSFAKLKGFEPKISDIRDGVSGCWLGDRNARTILVWLHGLGLCHLSQRKVSDIQQVAALSWEQTRSFSTCCSRW